MVRAITKAALLGFLASTGFSHAEASPTTFSYAFPTTDYPKATYNNFGMWHGLCVLGAESVTSTVTDPNFEYTPIRDFKDDMLSFTNHRSYRIDGVNGGGDQVCEGGTYLQPTHQRGPPSGVDVTVEATAEDENTDVVLCAFLHLKDNIRNREGNWRQPLLDDGFIQSEKKLSYQRGLNFWTAFCKNLSEAYRANTESPSDSPTKAPSDSPTTAPSDSPTTAPTKAPSDAPTKAPSDSPTKAPSDSPTKAPSDSPTTAPSDSPTKAPSNSPTTAPSDSPTKAPSNAPTTAPSDSPTKAPSDSPTKAPSDSPTKAPSNSPTKAPSNSPTTAPTKAPSDSPTKEPSNSPSDSPTKAPSDLPSKAPSNSPTTATSDWMNVEDDSCPGDVRLKQTHGDTAFPTSAVTILSQDTNTVTLALNQAWGAPVDKYFYSFSETIFSNVCYEEEQFAPGESLPPITIQCLVTSPLASVRICLQDTGSGLLSNADDATVSKCCESDAPDDTPTVCYNLDIMCETTCVPKESRMLRSRII